MESKQQLTLPSAPEARQKLADGATTGSSNTSSPALKGQRILRMLLNDTPSDAPSGREDISSPVPVVTPPANLCCPAGAKTYAARRRIGRAALLGIIFVLGVSSVWTHSSAGQGKQLPDGPGKVETQKLCAGCHEIERSIAPRQDRAGWQQTITKMVAFGMKAPEPELGTVLDYLVKHYPAEDVPRINVNKAKAIELESGLSLKRSQAAAIVEYREKHGAFKSLDDLKKVPGLDFTKFEAKKDRLIFEQ